MQESTKQRTLRVPLAFLRLFRIGDIWHGGQCCGSDPSETREKFEGLDIIDEAFDVKPSGLPLSNLGDHVVFPLPFEQFDAHRSHTGAYCVRVKVSSNTTLVVPCMELIRFYFGASGSLLKRLFSGVSGMNQLYTRATINPVTKRANLDLADGLHGESATTVGRIAFDAYAKSAGRWIVNSGVAASANGEKYYPKTTFPFRGKTNLVAEGRWITQADHRVFLAERLISCTHPFPFDELFYTSHTATSAVRMFRCAAEPKVVDQAGLGKPPLDDQLLVLAEAFVAPNLQAQSIIVNAAEAPFPDLLSKKVRRVKQRSEFSRGKTKTDGFDVLVEGETTSSGVNRGVEVTSEHDAISVEEIPAEAVEVFEMAFRELSEQGDGRARLQQPFSIDMFYRALPGFLKTDFLTRMSEGQVPEVWCARIEFNQSFAYSSLLALVRGHVNQESSTHIVIVRDVVGSRHDNDLVKIGIKKICTEFAEERIAEIGQANVIGILDTTNATNKDQVIRFLKQVINIGANEFSRLP